MRGQIIEAILAPLIIVMLFLYPTYLMNSFAEHILLEKEVLLSSNMAEDKANLKILGGCHLFTHFVNSTPNCSSYCVPRVVILNSSPVVAFYGK